MLSDSSQRNGVSDADDDDDGGGVDGVGDSIRIHLCRYFKSPGDFLSAPFRATQDVEPKGWSGANARIISCHKIMLTIVSIAPRSG